MEKCLDFFSFVITHVLTDNGLEFTNRLLVSKIGNPCQKPSKMDIKCIENYIQHKLTASFTPKINGMVERINGIIKNDTILKTKYKSLNEMTIDLTRFLKFYNLNRREGSLRKELKIKITNKCYRKGINFKFQINYIYKNNLIIKN